MGLIRWFTKNWANTTEPTHPDLTPLALPISVEATQELVIRVLPRLRGWKLADRAATSLHLIRSTRLFRFVDDIRLTFRPTDVHTQVHAESRSRIGKGDLGQNRRNILELFRAIRANL